MPDALVGAVVHVHEPGFPLTGKGLVVHCEAMVLGCDEAPVRAHHPDRLVVAPVAIFQFIGVYMNLHNQMKQQALGIKSSFQLQSLIFHKLLKVSPSSFIQKATQGEIINFIQVDSESLGRFFYYFPSVPAITIPAMMMAAHKSLRPMFFSWKKILPPMIVTRQADCFISVIIVILLAGLPLAMKRALSPITNIMASIHIQ